VQIAPTAITPPQKSIRFVSRGDRIIGPVRRIESADPLTRQVEASAIVVIGALEEPPASPLPVLAMLAVVLQCKQRVPRRLGAVSADTERLTALAGRRGRNSGVSVAGPATATEICGLVGEILG
jgi:hypothetical protein